MISGFFYASMLRPLPLAVVGVGATSILVNSLIAGLPTTPGAWTFYLALVIIQTVVLGGGVIVGERVSEQNEERRQALAQLQAATAENAGLHAQLMTQAREAGVLDERARMAREIHDTIAQGLIGIVTQLEAADQARDRPIDRDRHLDNAERLARESLTEARRSVEASLPGALEAGTLPEALRDIAHEWSELHGIPVDVTITGEVIALHLEIEVALLRTGQEALSNVARHARASHVVLTLSFMGDTVTLDVHDDGDGFTVPPPGVATGTGFGLTGMRQRVARVAGTVAIESELERRYGSVRSGPLRSRPARRSSRQVNAIRVIIVDDHPVVRDGLRGMLAGIRDSRSSVRPRTARRRSPLPKRSGPMSS